MYLLVVGVMFAFTACCDGDKTGCQADGGECVEDKSCCDGATDAVVVKCAEDCSKECCAVDADAVDADAVDADAVDAVDAVDADAVDAK